MTYAKGTSVSPESSQMEIRRTLTRYKIEQHMIGQSPNDARVDFVAAGFPVSVRLPIPPRPEKQFHGVYRNGKPRDMWKDHDQAVREVWRSVLLFIKAGLEAIERGGVKTEEVFMAFLVTGDGSTVGERVLPHYRSVIEAGGTFVLTGGPDSADPR